jgi:hypothetical protein
MKKTRVGSAGCLLAVALVMAACVPVLNPESESRYGENGERLVNLALNMGGGGGGAAAQTAPG